MNRVCIAAGKLAEKPYHMEKIDRNIYSVEELCYSLVQSAQFLGPEIMDPELVRWIAADAGLPELAEKLRPFLGKTRALTEFVSTILDDVGFVSQDRQMRTRQIVASGQGMEPYERRMQRAKMLEESGRAYQAEAAYEAILQDLPEPEREIRTKVLVACGTICARMFRFRRAAECFGSAYDLSGRSDLYLRYLAAVRFGLPDEEYVAFVSEHPECYNASLELEKRVKEADADYRRSSLEMQVARLRDYHKDGQNTNYEIALHQTIQQMKDDYRRTRETAIV